MTTSANNNNNYAYFMLSGKHLSIMINPVFTVSHSGMYIWATTKRTAISHILTIGWGRIDSKHCLDSLVRLPG